MVPATQPEHESFNINDLYVNLRKNESSRPRVYSEEIADGLRTTLPDLSNNVHVCTLLLHKNFARFDA